MARIDFGRFKNSRFIPGIRDSGAELWVISIFFLAGVIAGSFIGVYTLSGQTEPYIKGYLSPSGEFIGFSKQLWNCSKYHAAALLFGSSLFGVVCVPALSALRGYLLSFASAAVITGVDSGALPLVIVTLGLSSLITIPCFFVLARDSLSSSMRLIAAISGSPRVGGGHSLPRHVLVCAFFLTAAALAETYMIPALLQRITGT